MQVNTKHLIQFNEVLWKLLQQNGALKCSSNMMMVLLTYIFGWRNNWCVNLYHSVRRGCPISAFLYAIATCPLLSYMHRL